MWPFPSETRTAIPIQTVLKDAWLKSEKGIITNLPYEMCIGTCGQGRLDVDYKTLKAVFGNPDDDYCSGDYKIRKHWTVSIDGIICTIYDWKQGGQGGYRYVPLKRTRWSVGGSHPICRRLVQGVIDGYYNCHQVAEKVIRRRS